MSQETGFGPFGGNLPDAPTFGQSEIAQGVPSNPFDSAAVPEVPNGTVQTQMSTFNMTEMAQQSVETPPAETNVSTGGFNMQQTQSPFNTTSPTIPQTQSPFNNVQQSNTQSPFFNNQPQTNVNTFGTANNRFNNNNQQKYHIVDMCYLFNQTPNEPPLCIVGFNADFNNLRVGLHNINNLNGHCLSILKENIPRLTALNLYAEFCYQILITTNGTIPIIERTFNDSGPWVPNKSQIIRNPNMIQIQTIDMNNNQYSFTINEPMIGLFTKCLEFMINGGAWSEFLKTRM